MKPTPLTCTFDSNTWEPVALPGKPPQGKFSDEDRQVIRKAIEAGTCIPFLSDAVITLDNLKKVEKAPFFQNIGFRQKVGAPVKTDDGIAISVELGVTFDHFPELQPQVSEALKAALEAGFRFIKTPRIAWMKLPNELYKTETKEEMSARIQRSGVAAAAFEDEGLGMAHVKELAKAVLAESPRLCGLPTPLLAFAYGDEKKAWKAIAEWADADALAAHHDYQHDVFCTRDEGRNAGTNSVLRYERRQWLFDTFGIKVVSPAELADMLR